MRSTTPLRFQRQFEIIRRSSPLLEAFPDVAALLDHLHRPGGDSASRNEVLNALVRAAQCPDPATNAANTILLLALWPGLDAVHRRLARHYHSGSEELAAEIPARVLGGIAALDFARTTWIAATLIRNTERDIRGQLLASGSEARRRGVLRDDVAEPAPPCSALGLPARLDADIATDLITGRLKRVIGDDAILVVAVAVRGDRQHEAADALGISREAARKRYQRALRRLRVNLHEFG